MARRKTTKTTPEQTAVMEQIADLLHKANLGIEALEREAEEEGNQECYVDLINVIHRRLGESTYNLKQTLMDADDSEMRSPK